MKNLAVHFIDIRKIEVREQSIPALHEHQVLVQTILSAISSGTEMLFYHGLVPSDIPIDEQIPALNRPTGYPFKYGYAAVGKVIECGRSVDPKWAGRLVFSFHPHETFFAADPASLINTDGFEVEDAVFLASMETAVNFLMDGKPMIGERVMVFGQGVIGLLTTSLLAQIPLDKLITVEPHERKRKMSVECGAQACLDPSEVDFPEIGMRLLEGNGADLIYEVTGDPRALEQAMPLTGFDGRVVIGSWYGTTKERTALDSHFHRRRIKLLSSQVSTLAPEFTGAWTKQRRLSVAREMLRHIKPARLITHRIPIQEAEKAYTLLERQPEEAIGIVLTY
jgi:2-desacetyl-2-hydroxyethyl bacteriochlorophyllide A dehydrogenase